MQPPNWTRITDQFPRLAHDLWMIDTLLELRFNFLRARYEVWHPERGLVLRCESRAGDFAAPGDWMVLTISGRPTRPPVNERWHLDLERESVGREELAKRRRENLTGEVTPQSAGLVAASH